MKMRSLLLLLSLHYGFALSACSETTQPASNLDVGPSVLDVSADPDVSLDTGMTADMDETPDLSLGGDMTTPVDMGETIPEPDMMMTSCTAGETRECGTAVGLCETGTTSCDENGEWSTTCDGSVGPTDEVCDGLDNDCDGTADEGNPEGGDECVTGHAGLCAMGTLNCGDLGRLECQPTVAPGAIEEVCNGQDDDCDGDVDNGIDVQTDALNCGACGFVCPGPNPVCIQGSCYRMFWVSEVDGSNSSGDGSREHPWRTIAHALADGEIPAANASNGIPPARINVLPGRYAPDQWRNLVQCDADGDGLPEPSCAEHTVACELDGESRTVERCRTCQCDPSLTCMDGVCSLPMEEQERLPIVMRDTIQLVGVGDRSHIIIDGGLRTCFNGEELDRTRCENQRSASTSADRGRLISAFDLMDEEGDLGDENLGGGRHWSGIGTRNLIQNFTLLRGGYRDQSGIEIYSSEAYLDEGKRTRLRLRDIDASQFYATTAPAFLMSSDAQVLLERVTLRESDSRGARYLMLLTRTDLTIDSGRHEKNDVSAGGLWQSAGQVFGGAIVKVNDAVLSVLNSTFSNNLGGGVWFGPEGRGSVVYSTFAGNTSYGVVASNGVESPVIVANNIFTQTVNVASVFLHDSAQTKTHFHNNLFWENPGRYYLEGEQRYSDVVTLNQRQFASENFAANPRLVSVASNNLRLDERSSAIDAGTDQPLPLPQTSIACAADNDCIMQGAQSWWGL
ncbi:MAG: right-handed parallel beta-helix repeat-containing protein, partial [Bradymonadia bacterium]